MTDAIVLDSSAILALLNHETGAAQVEAVLDRAIVGAANLSEVAAKLADKGLNRAEIAEALAVVHDIRPMTSTQALVAGALRPPTRSLGLSLGDRACLALAIELDAVVMTCDGAWAAIAPDVLGKARVTMVR